MRPMTLALPLLLFFFSGRAARAEAPMPAALADSDVIELLGERVPRDLPLVDEQGRPVLLGDYLQDGRPVVLALGYYRCPMLCGLIARGLAVALGETALRPGQDFLALAVSIDPTEGPALAAERQRGHLQALGGGARPPDWPFLTGRTPALTLLAERVGFRYRYDAATRNYAHPAVLVVLAPDGRIARYIYGVRFTGRDLRLALVEASQGRVGTTLDRVLLQCYRYDPAGRRYALYVSGFLRAGGLAVFAALALLLARMWRGEASRKGAA